jgi:two-component system, chemotaxis family, CheB/CheR fusion protein
MIRAVVLVAGSAEPLVHVAAALPDRCGFAIVIVGPASDDLAERLRPVSALPVIAARGRVALEPDRIFVIPPGHLGSFQRGELLSMESGASPAPIDHLLRSLASELGARSAGVILGGRGSDGLIGIKRVKEVGGLTIAQTPDGGEAELPVAAIATGTIDLVLSLPEIGPWLVALARRLDDAPAPLDTAERPTSTTGADTLGDVLAVIRSRSGHDFGSYKRSMLYRRLARRMQVSQCESIAAYRRYLDERPDEIDHLLRDFLISVTSFFRDRDAFEALAASVIPRLFEGKTSSDRVRVWVAGCATGEEAYSIGMLLSEHAAQSADPPQLQIFATDVDHNALAEARIGRYPATIASDVSPAQLQRFFTPDGDHVRITKELRDIITFSPHNVLRDPPFSRLDLISCRNLLIYFNRDVQDRVFNMFHFGLRAAGNLFLGASESVENNAMFEAVDAKQRLFVRRPAAWPAGDSMAPSSRRDPSNPPAGPAPAASRLPVGELHRRLIERHASPNVLVSANLEIIHLSEHAGRWLQLSAGEPSRQLLRLVHTALRADLRAAIQAVRQTAGGSDRRIVRFDDGGTPRAVELRVHAIDPPELGAGSLLVFFDELELPPAGDTVGHGTTLRKVEDELRRTRDQLNSTAEQYETSLDELKVSNEELHASNEELRSATEELEASSEELQVINEELTMVNRELKLRVDEIGHANSDLQNLMQSTSTGVMFLDRALRITRFTPGIQELFNVIPRDIGRAVGDLTHRLEVDDLTQLAESVLQSLQTIEREARSRDGRRYFVRLLPYRTLEDRIVGVVLTFVDVTEQRDAVDARARAEAALEASEARLQVTLRTAPMFVIMHDDQLRVSWASLGGEELAPVGTDVTALFAPGDAERYAVLARRVLRTGGAERAELDVVFRGECQTYDVWVARTEGGIHAVGVDVTQGTRKDQVDRRDERVRSIPSGS